MMERPPEKDDKPSQGAMTPLLGFIMLLVLGGISWFAAPFVRTWMANTDLRFGALGWRILPITFPADWPSILANGMLALILFLFLFTILMIPILALMKSPEDQYGEMSAWVRYGDQSKKDKRKGKRKRR